MQHDLIGFTYQAYSFMTWEAIGLFAFGMFLLLWTGFLFGWQAYRKIAHHHYSRIWVVLAAGCVVMGIACAILDHALAFWNGYTYAIDHKARNVSLRPYAESVADFP